MKVGALCAGYGGIELGLSKIVKTELAWVSEIEPNASRLLQHRYGVPNHGDLTKIGVEDEVLFTESIEPVDIITAGFPCQPFSVAGDRKGVNDERWLIDDVCRIARITEAKWLILENVRGILTANEGDAMGRVCASMARHGFSRWEWLTLRASDIGAAHRRERWFCLATNSAGIRSQLQWKELRLEKKDREPCSLNGFGPYEPAIARWAGGIGRPPPAPTDEIGITVEFLEWLMGLPEKHVSGVDISRTAKVKMLGNGVIPLQGSVALEILLERIS